VLEGIMNAGRSGDMLRRLTADHLGITLHYYFDIPFEVTAVRHATRDQAAEFSVEAMREWYRERDLLGLERDVIGPESSVAETVGKILTDLGVETGGAVPLEG
jgi:hypothetical protein